MAAQKPITGGAGSAFNDWITQPAAWDTINLAGVQTNVVSHGLLKSVDGFDRDSGWQEKKGKGSIGATITYVQKPPAKGKVIFEVWTATHFQTWGQFRQLFLYNPAAGQSAKDQAISISYPSLDDLQISAVLVKKISPVRRKGKGKGVIEIDFYEYIPVPLVSAVQTITLVNQTPKSNMPAVGATPTTTAQKAKAGISTLLAQLQKT
jgi:hypothetical protein